ncbi:hypothetical protein FNV43_RR17330 [Rhamnella rubrinervis]|uniref:DNA-directed RNA polymerase III subunit RPC5 n=1 Tax=Rhamnella rubrinervis TaxID=2594499 RepID=A0A8K0DXB7_9ROSA|nr:hypothetical protein FNV43_RR17330 [Rhamnella rubrinervis]
MDLDDLDEPSLPSSRVVRFAPKSSKVRPKPKSEPASIPELVPKAEPEVPAGKPGARELEVNKNEGTELAPKTDVSASNGAAKMEVEPKTEAREEPEGNDPMEKDAAEDTVIREIDVFFNPTIDADTQLYVLQYPLRPWWRPYELDERCEEFRVKPRSSEVEVDLSLDVDSKNYDQDSGSKLSMTKQTLSCSWKPPQTTGYAVGVLMGNKLHLNPIHAVVQLRPSLEHLRSSGLKRKNNVTGDANDNVKLEGSSERKPVVLKKQNKQLDSSMEQKTIDEECWVPLKYHGTGSELCSSYLQRMVVQESSPVQFTMSPYDYIDSLCPGSSKNDIGPNGPSKRLLLSLPLDERIQKILSEGPGVYRFNALKHFAPDCTDEAILDVLQQRALLVQGLWALKSPLLYPEQSKESRMQKLARDYVLLLFQKSPVISYSELKYPASLKIAVTKTLNILAIERPSLKNWKFKEPTDKSFIKYYPGVVKKQGEVWVELERLVMNNIEDGKSARGAKNANMTSKPGPGRSLNSDKGKTVSGVGGKSIPDDIREALSAKVLPKVIQDHKVCSFQVICQGLRDLALNKLNLPKVDARIKKAAEYGTDFPDELRKLVDQVAVNVHGVYVAKSSSDFPQYDPLRNVVIELLRQKGPNAKLKKNEVREAAKKNLKRDIDDREYNKVVSEFCVSNGSLWMLKSGDGTPT